MIVVIQTKASADIACLGGNVEAVMNCNRIITGMYLSGFRRDKICLAGGQDIIVVGRIGPEESNRGAVLKVKGNN